MRSPRRIVAALPILFCASTAVAQTPPPTEPPPTEASPAAEATPPEGATPAPAAAEATPPAEAPKAEAPTAEVEASPTTGWFRIDTDGLDTQFWVGATHSVGSAVKIASDIYVVGSFAEFDIGPAFTFGSLALTPMIGAGFDFKAENAAMVAPQLFTIFSQDKFYFESWLQWFMFSPFADGSADTLYTRDFALYKIASEVSVGPQVEVTYQTNKYKVLNEDGTMTTVEPGILSLPVGGQVSLGYGEKNTLALFLGYDTKAAEDSDGIAGRFTFIRNW